MSDEPLKHLEEVLDEGLKCDGMSVNGLIKPGTEPDEVSMTFSRKQLLQFIDNLRRLEDAYGEEMGCVCIIATKGRDREVYPSIGFTVGFVGPRTYPAAVPPTPQAGNAEKRKYK